MTMDTFTGRDPTRPVAPAFTKLADIAERAAKRKGGLITNPALAAKLTKGRSNAGPA